MLHFSDEFETSGTRIIRYNMGSFGVNTYILIDKKTRTAAVIDPGGEVDTLIQRLRDEQVMVSHILFTHAHIDHIYGAEELKNKLPEARITYHSNEEIVVASTPDMCRMFGVPLHRMPKLEFYLAQTPDFSLGSLMIRTILTPGHTPGSVCFYIAEEKLCFTGDTLFKGSVGRTDFEGGSGFDLRKSLDLLLEAIPDDVQILPGHGKYSTMSKEKTGNFYLRVDRWR